MYELLGLQRLTLLGREKELQRIEKIARQCQREKKAFFLFIEGQGGIGKTHLLQFSATLAKGRSWSVSQEVLDLDNPEYATPWGLGRGLIAAAAGSWEAAPAKVRESWEAAYQALRRGQLDQLSEAWRKFEEVLRRYLSGKARNGLFIFRMDTAEHLREALEEERDAPEKGQEDAYPWELSTTRWLLERVFGKLTTVPVLWLVAGRPPVEENRDALWSALQSLFRKSAQRIKLGPLPHSARREYIEQLALLIAPEDHHGAALLREYIKTYADAFAQATQGFPLYMALAADLLRLDMRLPDAFYKVPDSSPDSRALAKEMHTALMQKLILHHSAIGYVLEKMARTRLGASEWMIKQWWDEALKKGLKSLYKGQNFESDLARLRALVTVKHFPHRRRAYFLHDEIYAFINTTWPLEEKESRSALLKVVLDDYRQERRAKDPTPEYAHQTEAEEVYYRVWAQPWVGYPFYLAKANDWAKTNPLAFRRLIRYMARLRRWMLFTEQREKARTFWDFWETERRFHDATLWGSRYNALEKAAEKLPETLPESTEPPQIALILRTLQGLTKALLAYYRRQPEEEQQHLKTAEKGLEDLKAQWGEGETTRLFQAILDNHYGLWYRRRGQMRTARQRYRNALSTLRPYRLEGTAGVLINLAYLEALLGHPRAAEGFLREASHHVYPGDKKTRVRLYTVSTLHYALIENTDAAAKAAKQVLQICAEEDYPRFRALTLIHWARALRGGWNRAVAWETNWNEALAQFLLSALRLTSSRMEAAKVIGDLKKERDALSKWEQPFGNIDSPVCRETAWELKEHLQPDEEAELYREIGRIWREWAWARHRQKEQASAAALNQGAEKFLWRAATGQTTPPKDWWQKPEERGKTSDWVRQQSAKASPFTPLAALVDLLWHYHYQKLPSHEEEAEVCQWALSLFPEKYRAGWENWPPQAKDTPPQEGPDDPRLWGQIGKIYMLWGHSCLRALRQRETLKEKEGCLREAVDKIALAMEYDALLGSNSPGLQRAEANLHDWLLRHGHERLNGTTVLREFATVARSFCQEQGKKCERLQQFMEERFA